MSRLEITRYIECAIVYEVDWLGEAFAGDTDKPFEISLLLTAADNTEAHISANSSQ